MRILHIITSLQKAAGTSVFAGEVANELVARGHEVSIAVVDPYASDCYPLDSRVHLISIADINVAQYDVVHIHALWAPVLSKIPKAARKAGVKVVWSPHGMLTPWALKNKWWQKITGLALYQWNALRKADMLHATAQSEVDDIRRLGLRNLVVVAPLGVKISRVERVERADGRKTLLFVSRVQRKKGLPNLLDAWSRIKLDGRVDEGQWKIRIIGLDQDNHTAELMSQCERLGISYSDQEGNIHCPTRTHNSHLNQPEVEFVGPVYGEALTREYASADLFVLPTHSENFGSVVIESLAQGVPVICTKGAPWVELETHQCGWWVDNGAEPLAEALTNAFNTDHDKLIAMGRNGLSLVDMKYTWLAVVSTLELAYLSVTKDSEAHHLYSCRFKGKIV